MKRIQLFEFEDFNWLPKFVRTSITSLIVVLHRFIGTSDMLVSLILEVKEKHDFSQIVDMGSGSGGAMPDVIQKINRKLGGNLVKLVLTDLHPDPDFIKQINDKGLSQITYSPIPFDATNFKDAPEGLKTMVNSFHHMPPRIAKNILKSANDNNEPLLIYEMSENKVPTILWWLLLPLSLLILVIMVLIMTPFVRPLTWKQLLFTYLIPVIPLFYAWDGQASLVRMYTFKDVDHLLEDIRTEGYNWEMGQAKKENGKKLGYYILGFPVHDN